MRAFVVLHLVFPYQTKRLAWRTSQKLPILCRVGHKTSLISHYTGQSVLAGTSVKNWRILLEQSFTGHMPLLMAASTFGLRRRRWISPQRCYLHHLQTL